MKKGHIPHSFCKFISLQTNTNNGHKNKINSLRTNKKRRIKTSTNKNPDLVINEVGTLLLLSNF